MEMLQRPEYDILRMICWQKTSCLMTADGTDDYLIKPEGIPNYSVPPLLLLDPAEQLPVTTNPLANVLQACDENEDIGKNRAGNIFEILDTLILA